MMRKGFPVAQCVLLREFSQGAEGRTSSGPSCCAGQWSLWSQVSFPSPCPCSPQQSQEVRLLCQQELSFPKLHFVAGVQVQMMISVLPGVAQIRDQKMQNPYCDLHFCGFVHQLNISVGTLRISTLKPRV